MEEKEKVIVRNAGKLSTHSFYESQNSPCKNSDKWHPSCLFTAYYTKGICASKHKGWKYRAGIARGRRLGSLEGQHGGRVQRQEGSVVWLIIMIQGGTVQFPEGVHLCHTKTLWKTSFYPLSTLWVDQEGFQARWSWNSPLDPPVPDQPLSSSCSPSKPSLV